MPPRKNLIGMRFGMLLVTGVTGTDKWRHAKWECLCDCGKKTIVVGGNMFSGGDKKSCGCLKHREAATSLKLEGQRFGKLVVLKRVRTLGDKESKWLCRCDCGVEKIRSGKNLTYGKTKSCGCMRLAMYSNSPILKRGKDNPNFKTGIQTNSEGYKIERGEDASGEWKYRPQSVLVMEDHIGRFLKKGETVHHKNGIRADNSIGNLELWSQMHPYGQRVEDMIAFCMDYLSEYAPEYLVTFKKAASCA